MDSCLASIERRAKSQQKFKNQMFFYFSTIIYITVILKYTFSLFIDFSYETKLLLFDLSILLGGIPKFNKIFIICFLTHGLSMNMKFHLVKEKNYAHLAHLIHQINGRGKALTNTTDNQIVNNLYRFVKIVYKLVNTSVITFGEFSYHLI